MSESYAGYSVYYYGSGGGQGMAGRIVDLGDDAVACTPDIKAASTATRRWRAWPCPAATWIWWSPTT